VAIKLAVVALVIIVGIAHIKTANYSPFIPPSRPSGGSDASAWKTPLITSLFGLEPAVFGIAGVIAGAAIVFFAFIGFDVVATTAEETRNPQRDVPIGVLGSLAIVTILYIAVCLVITGMQSYKDIDPEDPAPLATAFEKVNLHWISDLIAIGATIGLTVVVLILLMGQTRVAFAMARDGLLPKSLARVHPSFGTPYRITALTAVMVSLLSGFVPFTTLGDLVSIGTLFAFMLVSVGVLVLRRTRPELPRAFRVPGIYVVATASVLLCGYLMLNLIAETWVRFLVWMAIGLAVYFAYGRSHSRLGRGEMSGERRADVAADPRG
jgi:APA family basic amino acid/polyamine antiporter